jgi:uncharacterized protein YjdB
MKKISIYLLLMLVAGLTFTACGDDEAGYTPEVIDNPVSGVTITNATADGIVLPDAGATATVSVVLTPANGGDAERYYFEYTSSDPNIFTVDKNGLITAINAGSAILDVTAQNNVHVKTSCKVTVVGTRITTIDLPAGLTITHPNYLYLDLRAAATITPSDASIQTLSYTSSNPLVATMDEGGIVWPVWEGATTITATATDGSGVSATCEITVTITPITSITFRAITLNTISNVIANGATSGTLHVNTRRNYLGTTTEGNPDIPITKSGTNSSSNRIVYQPSGASRNTLSYTSSAPTIVDVESNASNYLVIKPQQNSPGTATVLIEATDGHGAAATLTIVNHVVYPRTGWTIVDHSPDGDYQGAGGPAENAISDEDVAAGLVKPDAYNNSPQGITESYFVVDLGAPTKFDYMLTEAVWLDGQPNANAYRINRVSLYGANTFDGASTNWIIIQDNITVNHPSYYIVPLQLNQSTYRYVKVVAWNNSTTGSYKNTPYWIIKNFWLGSAE